MLLGAALGSARSRPGRLWALSLLVVAGSASGESPERAPAGISPGAIDSLPVVDRTCTTFSWAATQGAEAYELQVVDVVDGDELGIALEVELPGGALSWTPTAERCLEAGRSYRWALRASVDGKPTGWSEGRQFRVSERPSPAEVARAYDILRRHLEPSSNPALADQAVSTGRGDGPTSAGPAQSADEPVGADISFEVEGRVEARGIDIVTQSPQYLGQIRADGEISARTGRIESPRFALATGDFSALLASLRSPALGRVLLCDAGGSCEGGGATADANLSLGALHANAGLDVGPGGLIVTRESFETGSGGAGFFDVPSLTEVNVDDNASECPAGSVVVAVRLSETDADQIGIQVKCSAP